MINKRKYSNEDIISKLNEYGYTYISGEYKNMQSKFRCYDEEGYIVYPCFDKLEHRNSRPLRFHSSNLDVEYNIGHYLELHKECSCTYVSGKYENSNSILDFRCECGNIFHTTFNNVRYSHKNKCDTCSGYNNNLTFDQVKNNLFDKGYILLVSKENYKGITLTDLICKDFEEYKYIVKYDSIMSGNGCYPMHKANPYSIENINKYFEKYSNNMFTCVSTEYINKKSKLEIQCNRCKRIFTQTWGNINKDRNLQNITENKTGARCPHCDNNQLESSHALVLKQVWTNEEKDTIVEDRTCINPNTNYSLPTDIVNHRLKIAIEIQSWFHDFEDQKIKDEIKKNFWINKGYQFYALDQRDYTILEMIQVFFPYIQCIPDYIDFEYSNKIDDVKIQSLLNSGMSVTDISKIVNCKPHQIYDAIQYGRISYPSNYLPQFYSPVVQLDLKGNYINEYDKIADAEKVTDAKNIAACLNRNRNYSGGFYWVYKNDYYSNNYTITPYRCLKYIMPVAKYTLDDEFICSYETIIEASKDNNCSRKQILDVVNGKYKKASNFIWKKYSK